MRSPENLKVKIVAAFLGLKFLPKIIALAFNNFNPKLVLSDSGVEYRAFVFTNHIKYHEIEKIDILLALQTTNIYLIRKNSAITVSANTNNKDELYRCLLYLRDKGCPFTEKAERFFLEFSRPKKV